MPKLSGKIAVVTGGGQGIGRAIALLFAREGAAIAVIDRNESAGKQVAHEVHELHQRSVAVGADVGEEDQVANAFRAIAEQLGSVDVLVNNAGIDTTSKVVDMPTPLWDDMIRVNLRSVFLCTRAVLPKMLERRSGRIINLASQLAYKGAPDMAHYAAAKAGVIGFTRSLAYEVAEYGVTVNAIAPGPIDTELFRKLPEDWRKRKIAELPIRRAGTVDEIAPTALLLASEEGSYYIGATLNPNGGDVMI
jgi:3-oxoacyl-[acyl-carrier protein] reductase